MERLYSIRQEFISNNSIEEIIVEEKDFDCFLTKYFFQSESLTIDDSSYNEEENLTARIFLKLRYFNEEDLKAKFRIIKAMGPIFEIALDKANCSCDKYYLLNYRKHGRKLQVKEDCIEFSLGDSNNPQISISMISLVYALMYNQSAIDQLTADFELITDAIVKGGFNSASYNGLQGYYYSRYFVKWLIDLKMLAKSDNVIDEKHFEEIFKLIETLKNPKDEILCKENL